MSEVPFNVASNVTDDTYLIHFMLKYWLYAACMSVLMLFRVNVNVGY